jgi:hypothetical protein
MEKLDLTGSGTVANAEQLVPDPFFDNGLAYGTGTLAAWTVSSGTGGSSTNQEDIACCSIDATSRLRSANITATNGAVYHLSGYYSCTNADNGPKVIITDANDSYSEVSSKVLSVPSDLSVWKEFHMSFTSDTTSLAVEVENTAGTNGALFTNLSLRKEFVQVDSTHGTKEISNRPVDANGNVDIAEDFCGDINMSEDGQTVIWLEKDNLNEYRPFLQNLKEVT